MSSIKDYWRLLLHFIHAQHINHQVVIAKARTALAQHHFFVTGFGKLLDNVTHLMRCKELRLLHIDRRTGFRHGNHQIGLASQKCRQLDNINHFCNRCCLIRLVNVSDHRHIKGLFDFFKNLQTFFHTRPTVRVDRRTVRFIERRLKHVGNAQLSGHLDVGFADFHGQVAAFQHIHAAEQREWLVVVYIQTGYVNRLNHVCYLLN